MSQQHRNTRNTELELRTNVSEAKFYKLSKNFMNYKINLATRVKMVYVLV